MGNGIEGFRRVNVKPRQIFGDLFSEIIKFDKVMVSVGGDDKSCGYGQLKGMADSLKALPPTRLEPSDGISFSTRVKGGATSYSGGSSI
jgi:hypothetical protein